MGSLPLWKGAIKGTIRIQKNQWSFEHCPVLCIIHFAPPFAQKCGHLPPPPSHTFLKRPFLTDFKKYTHTPPTPTGRNFGALDQKFIKPRKSAKTRSAVEMEGSEVANLNLEWQRRWTPSCIADSPLSTHLGSIPSGGVSLQLSQLPWQEVAGQWSVYRTPYPPILRSMEKVGLRNEEGSMVSCSSTL